MKEIREYPLTDKSRQYVQMPFGSQILTLAQGFTPAILALVDPNETLVMYKVSIYETGRPIPDKDMHGRYIGTFQDGWHVFASTWEETS